MALKILFLSHKFYPDIGGIEVNSEILATAFHNAGHTVRLLTWSKDPSEKIFPYRVQRNPDLLSLVQAHQWADVVYENNPCLRLAWPSLIFRRPSVVALRTWVCRSNGNLSWRDHFKLNYLKKASAVIAVSNAIRKKSWSSAKVIGNPYRATLFQKRNNHARKGFVFLGRLVSDKGADMAIQAIHQLLYDKDVQQKDDLVLTIIGKGPDAERLTKLTNDLRLENRIKFTGPLEGEALVETLNKHKYLVVPSRWEEPFGNVALEGLGCGCIPIVSDGGGLPEAVGDAGLVFKRGDLQSLSQSMSRVLTNAALVRKLHQAAPEHLKEHAPGVITQKYLNVIEQAFKTTAQ